MGEIRVHTPKGETLSAELYEEEAPEPCRAFLALLPTRIRLFHARFAGEEVFTEEGPLLEVPLENASSRLEVGEMGAFAWSPRSPKGFKGGIIVVYGVASLIGCPNVFSRVVERDLGTLREVGLRLWKKSAEEFLFEKES